MLWISVHHSAVHHFCWHVCQTKGSHSFPPPEPQLHTLLCFLFSTQLLKYIIIIYIVRTMNLHHPACHILCSLLSPHSYHLSVPSGIRSSYQWYGASASSSVKSRSRWEGWCWKDSGQGEENIETFKPHCCEDGSVLTPFKQPSVLRLALNLSE